MRKFTETEIHYFKEQARDAIDSYQGFKNEEANLKARITLAELRVISAENMLASIEEAKGKKVT